MSIHRRAARRDANETAIIDALRAIGAQVYQISGEGVPDTLVSYRGATFLLEVKGRKGKLTPAQERFFASWQGGAALVVRTVDDALRAIGAVS